MAELITVPTFTFNQGDVFAGCDVVAERPVRINFYLDSIEIEQDGDFDQPERVLLSVEYFEKLVKEIRKHLPEATKFLKERYK